MTEKRYELTRRKALAGLGTIGVASAGAGLGTSALFSDTESLEGNMITAGELDLAVDYVVHEDQGSAGSYTINSFAGTVNGEPADQAVTLNGDETAMSQNLNDVKPGDSGHSYFCFTIDDNPAYLWACGELTDSKEQAPGGDGPYTEPEPEDNNGEGELEENIEVTVSYCSIDQETGEKTSTGNQITSGSLAEVLDALNGGIPLDGGGDGSATAETAEPYAASSAEADNPCLCFEWELPISVGNIIQGDYMEFDLQFFATQSRHNDENQNPCLTGETGDGFPKLRDDFDPSWNARGIIADDDASTGSAGFAELDIRDASDNDLAEAGADWPKGEPVDFKLNYSGGAATLNIDGATYSVSASGPEPTDDDVAIMVKSSGGGTVSVSNVQLNGVSPGGVTGVSTSSGTSHLYINGGGIRDGDDLTGEVTFDWSSGNKPDGENLKFRIDA